MKKIILTVTLVTLAFGFSTAQRKPITQETRAIKQVEVTPRTVTSQPRGKPYLIDLTLKRTTYNVAANIDYRLVQVRTTKGLIALSDVIKPLGRTGKLLVGTLGDLRDKVPPLGDGTAEIHEHDCSGVALCTCDHAGCTLLELQDVCLKNGWFCDDKGNCVCVKK